MTYTCVAWPMWVNQKCTSYWGNEYLDGWQRQSIALTHLHLRREAHPAWYMDTDPCIIPIDPCWMPLRGILCGPYSGLLVFGQLWLGAICNFLKRWTVVTDPNCTGVFLCYGFLRSCDATITWTVLCSGIWRENNSSRHWLLVCVCVCVLCILQQNV